MTTLTAWRAARTQQLTLPSGLIVTVRKVDLADLLARGRIPTPLVDMVMVQLGAAETTRVTPEAFGDYVAMVNTVVAAALIDPPLAETPDATHLTIDELPLSDRLAIWNWAQAEGAQFAAFPGQSNGNASAASSGDAIPATPGDAAGD